MYKLFDRLLCIVRENVCNKANNVKKSRFWILKKNVKYVLSNTVSKNGSATPHPKGRGPSVLQIVVKNVGCFFFIAYSYLTLLSSGLTNGCINLKIKQAAERRINTHNSLLGEYLLRNVTMSTSTIFTVKLTLTRVAISRYLQIYHRMLWRFKSTLCNDENLTRF